MKNMMYAVALGASMLMGAVQASAAHWVTVPGSNFYVGAHQAVTLPLGCSEGKVEKLIVQASGVDSYVASLDVFINLDYNNLKGNPEAIGTPRRSTVTINDVVQTIQVSNTSNVGANIYSIEALLEDAPAQPSCHSGVCAQHPSEDGDQCDKEDEDCHHRQSRNAFGEQGEGVGQKLQPFATDNERKEFLTPIKKAADRVATSGRERPILSLKLERESWR